MFFFVGVLADVVPWVLKKLLVVIDIILNSDLCYLELSKMDERTYLYNRYLFHDGLTSLLAPSAAQ